MKYHLEVKYVTSYHYIAHLVNRSTFEDFTDNLELNLDKIANKSPYLLVVLGHLTLNHQIGINMIKQLMKVLKLMQ